MLATPAITASKIIARASVRGTAAASAIIPAVTAASRASALSAAPTAVRSLATVSPDFFDPTRQRVGPRPVGTTPPVTPYVNQFVNSHVHLAEEPPMLPAQLTLKSGESFAATSFGAPLKSAISGEVVFTTSLVGYPESMTDPSYRGQILVFTQPLVGNYGVPAPTLDQFGLLEHFESNQIQVKAIVVNDYATKYSHWNAIESLGKWCARNGVAAISGVDTRAVVSLLREQGSTLGSINIAESVEEVNAAQPLFEDPNARNLVAEVSTKTRVVYNQGAPLKIALIDCGVKQNIIRCLAKRGAEVHVLPWDHNLVADQVHYDGVFLSNGPGDPRLATKTVNNLRAFMSRTAATAVPTPIFGICMGNQLLGLSAGFSVYKLPYGNRGHNQPAIDLSTGACVITSQNHGYAINDTADATPAGWAAYFRNANDGSNEGVRSTKYPWRSVQFHPEAKGGPMDTEYLFGEFLEDVVVAKKAREARGKFAIPETTVAERVSVVA